MASLTTPTQASAIPINGFICINDRPCKVVDKKYKYIIYGGCQIHFIGIDIFTDKKYERLVKSRQYIDAPIVTKNDYQLLDIDEGRVAYLDNESIAQEDLVLPDFVMKTSN